MNSKWISVEEALPEIYSRVLISGNYTTVASREPKTEFNKDWGMKGEWCWIIINDCWCDIHEVTHWMPLPQPPSK